MIREPQYIVLNGNRLYAEDISRSASSTDTMPNWEKELFSFLNEWFSASSTVPAHTSGSTGEPKPIDLPKTLMQYSAERTIAHFGLRPNNRLLLCLPCCYIAGKMMVVRAVVGQMELVAVDPSTDFDFLEHDTFNLAAMVPNQVFKLLEQPNGVHKLQNISNLIIGGSSISSILESRIAVLSNRVAMTYGMTETASHVALRDLNGNHKSEFYSCLPGVTVSTDTGGRLLISHPDLPDLLQTNDLAELRTNTEFRVLGRADSVIVSGGIKYSPEVIEKKLERLIDRPFMISAVPDARLGEKLVLVIEGQATSTDILKLKIARLLPEFECPKAICFVECFPRTESGKFMRKALKKHIAENTCLND